MAQENSVANRGNSLDAPNNAGAPQPNVSNVTTTKAEASPTPTSQQASTPQPVTQGGPPVAGNTQAARPATTPTSANRPATPAPPAQGVRPAAAARPGVVVGAPQSAGPAIARPSFIIRTAKTSYKYLNLLIYGDFGVGKTQLAASSQDVPEMQDVLFIDIESGGRTIEDREDIDVVGIDHFSQFARVYEFLRMHCQARDANDIEKMRKLESFFKTTDPNNPYVVDTPKRYNTVIVDSLTEVQKYCMYQLLGVRVGEFALDMEPENPQYAEWNKSTEMIRLLVRSFRNLNMNTIFVCSRIEDQDERKRFFYAPALPGKLSNEVQGFFDAVGYYISGAATEGGQIQRRLYLTPGQTFKAKNRFSKFNGTHLDNPTMSDIFKLSQL